MSVDEKLDILLAEMQGFKLKVDNMDIKFDNLANKFDNMDIKFDSLANKVDKLESKVDKLESKVDKLESKVDSMEQDIKIINLRLENELSKNIVTIAEGHLDLSRKLDEVIHTTSAMKGKYELVEIMLRQYQTKFREIS